MQSTQNKQRELEMFDVRRESEFELLGDSFYKLAGDRLEKHAPQVVTGGQRVLEAGCGTGAFGRHFIKALEGRAAWNVTGVDLAPAMVEWNREHPLPGYDSLAGDLEDESLFATETFDVVLCPMVLHHFPNPAKVMRNLAAWLKPGGIFYIIEPNGSSPVNRFFKFGRHCVEKIMGLEYAKRFATVNETDHAMGRYLRELGAAGCEAVHRETRFVKTAADFDTPIHAARRIMQTAASVLPMPLRGNLLLVVARKKS